MAIGCLIFLNWFEKSWPSVNTNIWAGNKGEFLILNKEIWLKLDKREKKKR